MFFRLCQGKRLSVPGLELTPVRAPAVLAQLATQIRGIADTTVKNNGLFALGTVMSDWNELRVASASTRKTQLAPIVSGLNQVEQQYAAPAAGAAPAPPNPVNNSYIVAAITGLKDIIATPLSNGTPSGTAVAARGALTGNMSTADLAAVLAHEASHTLSPDATADIAYRQLNAHFYLPPKYTACNAANFEQVAREVLSGVAGPSDSEAAAMHTLAVPRLKLAAALLSSRVTRAWVRAFDLETPSMRSPDTLQGLPALPVKAENIALVNSLIEGLFTQTTILLDLVNGGGLTLTDSPSATTVTAADTPGGLTITFPRDMVKIAGPPQLAAEALGQILSRPMRRATEWYPYSPDQITTFIGGIENLDRQNLRAMLQDYYGSFAQSKDMTL